MAKNNVKIDRVLIVMPAYNEAKIIRQTINDLLPNLEQSKYNFELLVVDDGSSDKTYAICRELGIKIIRHPFNCGVGIALRTGFKWASENEFDAVIQIDADGQHPSSDIDTLISTLESNYVDIVVGSRFLAGPWNVSGTRKAAMRFLAFLVSFGTGHKITDATSGFRVSGKRAISYFAKHYPGEYLGDTVESLVLAHHEGLAITEVPANLQPRQGGSPSHLSIRSSLHVLRVIVMVVLILIRPTYGGDEN